MNNEKAWLQAKAHALRQQALATSDRGCRKLFLTLAWEYQKLAGTDAVPGADGAAAIATLDDARRRKRSALSFRRSGNATSDGEKSKLRRSELIGVVAIAALAIVALVLVVIPGDQTAAALRVMAERIVP